MVFGNQYRFLIEECTKVLCNLVDCVFLCPYQSQLKGCLLCVFSVFMDIAAFNHIKRKRGVVCKTDAFENLDILFGVE